MLSNLVKNVDIVKGKEIADFVRNCIFKKYKESLECNFSYISSCHNFIVLPCDFKSKLRSSTSFLVLSLITGEAQLEVVQSLQY